ncbi:MAG: xanthine dehydrogenase family protein subunit M [Vicinamibacterales bacterium]
MYASNFTYLRAGSLAEATTLLQQHPGAKVLAGGHSLIPLMKLRLAAPAAVVDIGRVAELHGISLASGHLRIGALTTHAELAASPVVRDAAPALAEAAAHVGDPTVRNRGTIGGNVAHADPASDLPAVLTALGARFVLAGPAGTRTVAASDFFHGMMATAVGEHDILTSVELPAAGAGQGSAYAKFEHPASRYAVVGVAAVVTVSGGACAGASVVLGGLTPAPVRAGSVERALVGHALSADVISAAASRVGADLGRDVMGDLYASGEYRVAVAPVYVTRAVTAAADRAR